MNSPISAPPKQIRILDLFAGAGGLAIGFHRIGADRADILRAIELDPAAAATYAANFGVEIVYQGRIEDWLVEEDVPSADVVIGGPPCQGFSLLGKRDQSDERNVLWRQYVEVIHRAQPSIFVLENVPAFMGSAQLQDLLAETDGGLLADYRVEMQILNAADFGAAQLRKRALLIGSRSASRAPGLPQGASNERRSVTDAWLGLDPVVTRTELPQRVGVAFGRKMPGPFRSDELHISRQFTDLSLARFASIPAGGNRFDLPDNLLAPCWRKHKSGAGDVMGRLDWTKPSVTIRTEFFKPEKGRYLHPNQDRSITHAEAARLQGFPDDFLWMGSKTSIARQIGNAVPVELSEGIALHVIRYIDSLPDRPAPD